MPSDLSDAFNEFYEQRALFGRLWVASLIVLLSAFAFGFQAIGIYYALGAGRFDIANAVTIEWAFRFAEPLLLWGILSVFFLMAIRVLGEQVRFGRLIKLTGFGFAPLIASGLIWSVGHYIAYQGIPVPEGVRIGVLSSERDAFVEITAQASGDPSLVGSIAVGGLFLIASVYLWVVGIEYSSSLDRRRATAIAALPAVLYFAFSIVRFL